MQVAEGDGSFSAEADFKIAKCYHARYNTSTCCYEDYGQHRCYPASCTASSGENAGKPDSAICGYGVNNTSIIIPATKRASSS